MTPTAVVESGPGRMTEMNVDALARKKQSIIEKFGPWAASNIHVGGNLYTIGEGIHGDEIKLRRVLQVVADMTRRPLSELRLLDLACHEGIYATEFARQGMRVLGIEAREAHIEKLNFVKEALSLGNLDVAQDDVRNLSEAKYGLFDVVLCLGILYHLDAPDVFSFIERIGEVCTDVAVIDTRITLGPTESIVYKGTKYWGHRIQEGHSASDTPEQKMKRYWASIDNLTSFHLSRTSLYSLLARCGFTSVYECYVPAETAKPIDRITMVAVKGTRQKTLNSPLMENYPTNFAPEEFTAYKMERAMGKLYRMSRMIPEKVRVLMKSGGLLGSLYKPLPETMGRKR
jgi:2-polyprenyl-3-methyl-5-hydroxy-6-metoxy-1,4-benzoquinol methylase